MFRFDGEKTMAKKVAVTVNLPRRVDVSIRGASTAMRVDVRIDGEKMGSLNIGSGSIAWWPKYTSDYAHRLTWRKFIEEMEKMPTYKIAKKLGKRS